MIRRFKFTMLTTVLFVMLTACNDAEQSRVSNSIEQKYSQLLVYPQKTKIEAFSLQAHDESVFDQSSFDGRWNLLFMGYTNCPDVCPLTLSDITKIYKKISPELQKKFQILFLSVDPERDDLEHIADYLDYFHQDFVGITGDSQEIDKLVKALGGIYALNSEDEKYYTVDHTARIFIVNPQGQRYGIISSEAMHNQDKTLLISELSQMASE